MKQGRLLFAIDQQRYAFVDKPPTSPMTALGQYYCMALNDRNGSLCKSFHSDPYAQFETMQSLIDCRSAGP